MVRTEIRLALWMILYNEIQIGSCLKIIIIKTVHLQNRDLLLNSNQETLLFVSEQHT